MITLQEINHPSDCIIIHHELFDYNPLVDFSEEKSLEYLHEDLFQCRFPEQFLLIDAGWYGNPKTNEGEFRIHTIVNENWDYPFNVIHTKSVKEVPQIIMKIMKHFTDKVFMIK
jgi:hypothetical protein